MFKQPSSLLFVSFALLCFAICGCVQRSENEVVAYVALDKEFSESILQQFESETGVKIRAKYDQESNKTLGLVQSILNERDRPRCDLFWNNEILHTLRLQREGILRVYLTDAHSGFPGNYRGASGHWYGLAARARILIINLDLIPNESDWPRSVLELANPKWKKNCGIARPLFGTTATHAAVLFDSMGLADARAFFEQIAKNANIEGGNKRVAINVARGKYAFGLTDTDDAIIELEKGANIAIVFPDQADDQVGTLFIPNTLCIIKNGPNTSNAKRLVDFLLSPKVEKLLAEGPSAQFPLGPNVEIAHRLDYLDAKRMKVNFESAADSWDETSEFLASVFAIGK